MTTPRSTEAPDASALTLYLFEGCPYCELVRRAIRDLGVTVAERNIHRDPEARHAIVRATRRSTVPVLEIPDDAGGSRFMPESADIVRYLYETHGGGKKPGLGVWVSPMQVVVWLLVVGFAIAMVVGR